MNMIQLTFFPNHGSFMRIMVYWNYYW